MCTQVKIMWNIACGCGNSDIKSMLEVGHPKTINNVTDSSNKSIRILNR